jgi:exopolyphosphatase/guanosine-5'-triphosphate,3'-diphosphate pyrophosphatase
LLEAASLLHDVGQLVSYPKHHRHSYSLITHAERLGLAPRERSLVALISRYHRRTGPRKKHPEFAALPPDDQDVVRRVSAILRVADGLDRGHSAAVETVTARLDPGALVLTVAGGNAQADLGLECWGASRKADVMGKLLERDIVVTPAGSQ